MPVNWIDGVTDVNAANMEILDTDIAARQVTTEKGAANGYAPLDATAKVPLANLPPVSGVDFIGAWGSGIAYKKGDVVSYLGNDYMAVNDSTGVTPPAPGTPILQSASYGTTLPSSPFNGQEHILVDSLTAPAYRWRSRYNASIADAYKWEYIGGTPILAGPQGSITTASTTFVDITGGPTTVIPRAGIYLVQWGVYGNNGGTYGGASTVLTQALGTTSGAGAEFQVAQMVATYGGGQASVQEVRSLSAGETLKLQVRTSSAGSNAQVANVTLALTPLRLA